MAVYASEDLWMQTGNVAPDSTHGESQYLFFSTVSVLMSPEGIDQFWNIWILTCMNFLQNKWISAVAGATEQQWGFALDRQLQGKHCCWRDDN